MNLPVASPLQPMLAKRADALPEGDGWIYGPRWDGFRVLADEPQRLDTPWHG